MEGRKLKIFIIYIKETLRNKGNISTDEARDSIHFLSKIYMRT